MEWSSKQMEKFHGCLSTQQLVLTADDIFLFNTFFKIGFWFESAR